MDLTHITLSLASALTGFAVAIHMGWNPLFIIPLSLATFALYVAILAGVISIIGLIPKNLLQT